MSTELEQQLRGAMERFTEDVRLLPGLAVKAQRHQQKRRMTTRAVAAAGTAAAVAAAVAVAGAAGAFGSASRPPVQTAYTAYVISHVETPWPPRAWATWSRRTARFTRPAAPSSRSRTTCWAQRAVLLSAHSGMSATRCAGSTTAPSASPRSGPAGSGSSTGG
jgi:hypothetical protein